MRCTSSASNAADPNPPHNNNNKKASAALLATSTMHRKIHLTGSHLTSSTASLTVSATEDDEHDHVDNNNDDNDSFTDLICRHHRKRSVRFRNPPAVHLTHTSSVRRSLYAAISDKDDEKGRVVLVERGGDTESNDSRQGLWYSKSEVQGQRHDVQKTIRSLRRHAHCVEGSAHVLLSTESSSSSCRGNLPSPPTVGGDASGLPSALVGESTAAKEGDVPPSVRSSDESNERDNVCYRGCERYYSLETRFMAQKMVVDAVLDAQSRHRTLGGVVGGDDDEKKDEDGSNSNNDNSNSKEEALRRLSEEISKPGRELAQWHATLNAFQCYGFSGLSVSTDASKREMVHGDGFPKKSNMSKDTHSRSKSLQADTLWWEQAVLTTEPSCNLDSNFNPAALHPATSPLTSDEDEDSSLDDVSVGGRYQEAGTNNVAPSTFGANVVTPPPRHRRSRSMPSPPTEYIFAPATAAAASAKVAAAATTTTSTAASWATTSPTSKARSDRFPHVVPPS